MVLDKIGKKVEQGPCHAGSCGTNLDLILKAIEAVTIIQPVGNKVSTLTLQDSNVSPECNISSITNVKLVLYPHHIKYLTFLISQLLLVRNNLR